MRTYTPKPVAWLLCTFLSSRSKASKQVSMPTWKVRLPCASVRSGQPDLPAGDAGQQASLPSKSSHNSSLPSKHSSRSSCGPAPGNAAIAQGAAHPGAAPHGSRCTRLAHAPPTGHGAPAWRMPPLRVTVHPPGACPPYGSRCTRLAHAPPTVHGSPAWRMPPPRVTVHPPGACPSHGSPGGLRKCTAKPAPHPARGRQPA